MKFNFKSISYLLIGLILGSLIPIQSLLAESPIRLLINGQYINCDVQPQIINGRTMVPVSIISTALGATVSWDENTQTVIINGQGYVAPSNSNTSNTVNNTTTKSSEMQEFLGYNNKVNNILAEIDYLLSKETINESEHKNLKEKVYLTVNELKSWGELYYYSDVKNIYIKCLAYGELSCYYKKAVNDPENNIIKTWTENEYKKYLYGYNDSRQQLKAEISRLQKENHM